MRIPITWRRVGRISWLGYASAAASIAVMSLIIGLVLRYVRIENISMLYLVAVLAVAVVWGSGPAVVASVLAFFTFDWFFVPPVHEFTISDPSEWVALLNFLLIAIITGQLAALVRRRAIEAERREREAAVLYDVARIMSGADLAAALGAVARRLLAELDATAVAIDVADGSQAKAHAALGDPADLALIRAAATSSSRLLGAGEAPSPTTRGGPGPWIRIVPAHARVRRADIGRDRVLLVPIKSGERRLGTLVLALAPGVTSLGATDTRLLSAVGTQLGLAAERVRLQREATEAEILRRADELKTALLNAVSHDLRTPLASIIASAGSLRQQDVTWTDDERRELAEAIEEEALRLNRIVGNLLDLSRIEGDSLRPEKGWYDVGALVDDVLGRLRPLTAEHPVSVSVPEDLPPVPLDYVEIDQVLSNLVENAVKYTPTGTPIHVRARRADGQIEIEVRDHGPGIPRNALPRLFERFYRAEGAGPRPQGTGVGLTVAKGLVEAHGGRIWAENVPGGGARFVFTLPLAPSPLPTGRPSEGPEERAS